MKSRINRDEREISISELWWYVISKWKWLVVGMVVGALLMGAFGVYKEYSANIETPKEITMEDLSIEEQEEVKTLINDYEFYLEEVERLEQNYLMNMNYDYLNYFSVAYYINTEYSYNYLEVKENYVLTLISAYKLHLQGKEVDSKLMEVGIEGLEVSDLGYIRSVFSEGYLVEFGIMATNYDEAEAFMKILCDEIEAYYPKAVELIGEHSLTKISESNSITYSEGIKNAQLLRTAYSEKLLNNIEAERGNLTNEQIQVYNNLIQGSEKSKVDNKSLVIQLKNIIGKIVVGVIGGVILVAFANMLTYLFGSKVYNGSDFKNVYGLDSLGEVLKEHRKKFHKSTHDGSDTDELDRKKYIAEIVSRKCKQNNAHKITMCSTLELVEESILDIASFIGNTDIECVFVGNINEDVEALKMLIESKNVVFVEKIGSTNKNSLIREIELCDKFSIAIHGVIVLN